MIRDTQFGPGDDAVAAKWRRFKKRKRTHRKQVKAARKRRLANLRGRG